MNAHNPQTNHQIDELQNVIALLHELPRVSAPADFNSSLKARIAAAKAEAHEFADITALTKELPRVAAPADFDFKLRARIAQAKSEQQQSSAGWFAELFGRSFSWLQASAAMAAVAIVVSVVTIGVMRENNYPTPDSPNQFAKQAESIPTVEKTAPASVSVSPSAIAVQPTAIRTETATPIKTRNIKYNPRPVTPMNAGTTDRPRTPAEPDAIVASAVTSKVMIKHQSGEARMVNLSEYNLGLQTAHLRQTQVRNTPGTETALANIY